jgi:hypothetical protein
LGLGFQYPLVISAGKVLRLKADVSRASQVAPGWERSTNSGSLVADYVYYLNGGRDSWFYGNVSWIGTYLFAGAGVQRVRFGATGDVDASEVWP